PVGGICVSGRAYDDLRRLGLPFESIGKQQLKNIDEPIEVYQLSAEQLAALPMEEAPADTPGSRRSLLRPVPIALAVAALALLALVLWRPWSAAASPPSVTVVAGGGGAEAQALARNLLVQLGSLQATKADALELVEPESGTRADLIFKVESVGGEGDLRANLSLVDNRGDTLLWSREVVQPGGNRTDLRQQIAYSAARVLGCATEALSPLHEPIALPTLRLYLNGCADLADLLVQQDSAIAVATFRKVTEQAPAFAGGWAKLLLAQIQAFRGAGLNDPALRREIEASIAAARKLDPDMAEALLAEGWLQPRRPIAGWLRFSDEAVAKNPDHAEALGMRSLGLVQVGRMREAVDDARRAVGVEPLSPFARKALIHRLMDSGATGAARNALREAERLWPGATDLVYSRFVLEYGYGDAGEAWRILEAGGLNFPPTAAQKSFIEARIDASPAKVERALADAREAFERDRGTLDDYAQALAQFGRGEEAIRALLSADPRIAPDVVGALFRPPFEALHADPRFMAVAQRFGLVQYWRDSGRWPDFCSRPGLPYDCKAEAAKLR
ncbi:MAG TPA: hypothetical protein VF589_05935, partial [Allosphingosinicella sp.]